MFDSIPLETKIWLATEIRIWGLAAAAILAVISFTATWAQTRWQTEQSAIKQELEERRRAESEERIAEAVARAAEANQKAEEERLARVKIEERLADRRISDAQAATIVSKIHEFSNQEYDITTFWDMREPLALSERIHKILTVAGWKFVKPEQTGFMLGGKEGIDLFVHPKAMEKTKKAATALISALNADGLAAHQKEINDPNDTVPDKNKIHLNVGTKP